MSFRFLLYKLVFLLFIIPASQIIYAQEPSKPVWGPKDTIIVSMINYEGEILSYKELQTVYVSNLPPEKLAKAITKYNRLRNAVYVTYPYARTAGATLNDVAFKLKGINGKNERKKYIKSREKELKEKFSDPLTNLSVYQGKVLMKLINRQTGNNCYEIIKEYKGSLNARMYQTVAFFFGSNLKQDYDVANTSDRQIEAIVNEIDATWYNNPFKPGIK
jgi:benzoyl-CoA reductase/2-hydroxyglutaryl-CoA dehydratase subunit BcrC/BadD/HgdB